MKTSPWAMGLWIGGFVAHFGLLYTLLAKRRWVAFPVFSSFIAFGIIRTVTLSAVRSTHNQHAYFWSWWGLAILDYLFQLALIAEIGLAVLGPVSGALSQVKTTALIWLGFGIVLAGAICMSLSSSSSKPSDLWDARISLFTSLLTCQCYLVLLKSIEPLGIRWNHHVLAIGNGLALWSVVALVGDGIGAMTGRQKDFPVLDRIKMSVYIAVSLYWTFAMWRAEPRNTLHAWPPLESGIEATETKAS